MSSARPALFEFPLQRTNPRRRIRRLLLVGGGSWLAVCGCAALGLHSGLLTPPGAMAIASGATLLFSALGIWRALGALSVAEQALLDNTALCQNIVNGIPQMAWIANAAGNYAWVNERWNEYFGCTLADLQGDAWRALYHPEQVQEVHDKWNAAHASKAPWEGVYQLRARSGEYRWFLSRALPLFDERSRTVRWFGTETDIDDQVRAKAALADSQQRAERASLAKTQFLANMSHEIRTPIGVIMGFVDLLKAPGLASAKRAQYMQIIAANSTLLLRLIDDILDLSKVEAGKLSIENAEVSLGDFLQSFTTVMALHAEKKGIRFALTKTAAVPAWIYTDALRLRQILDNIVGNAIKFTEHGHVLVGVDFAAPLLRFTVQDSGTGLSPEHAQRLFQAFSQADASTTRRFGGTGLGLVLSRSLSKTLGGDVVLQHSEIGRGSTFVVTVNVRTLQRAAMPAAVRQAAPVPSAGSPGGDVLELGGLAGLKVLIVEDSPDNQTLLTAYLEHSGVHITTADNGRDGYRQALAGHPDIVLMDVQMPEMDGHETTKKLRAAGFTRPIIALTAHAMYAERQRCFAAGCTEYLTKPLARAVLLEVLGRYAGPCRRDLGRGVEAALQTSH